MARGVPLIYNVPGRPDLMGIEQIWAQVRAAYRKAVVRHLVLDEYVNIENKVLGILGALDDDFCGRCCNHALNAILQAEPLAPAHE